MNIYLIRHVGSTSWDEYDSAVVIAESISTAREMRPDGKPFLNTLESSDSWVLPRLVKVKLIGKSILSKPQVICASFNAG